MTPKKRKKWTTDEVHLLHELYPGTETKKVARQLKRPIQSVLSKAKRLGVAKADNLGRTSGRFNGALTGAERVRPSSGYVMRKTKNTGNPDKDWQKVHRLVWEEHNGPIPPEYRIVFRDGNPSNPELSNLMLLPSVEAARRGIAIYWAYPKEIRSTLRTLGKLKKAIRQRGVENYHEEQD